jgi:hypothetical protein
MSIQSELVRQFGSFGSYFLITPELSVIGFGEESNDDFAFKSFFNLSTKKSTLYSKEGLIHVSSQNTDVLLTRFNQLIDSTPSNSFHLSSNLITVLQDTIVFYNATHLRFYSHKRKIFVSVFDYRKFVNDVTPLVDKHTAIAEIELEDIRSSVNFSYTIKSSSFLKLPTHSFDLKFCVMVYQFYF